jgi:flagellar biosynthetic protein FliR
VTGRLAEIAILAFVVFCRVGAALMLLPGFSSPRIPVMVRFFLALALSFSLAPFVAEQAQQSPGSLAANELVTVLVREVVIGLAIGATGALIVHGARLAGDVISSSIGLGGIPGQPVDANEPLGQLAALFTLAITMFIFASGLHLVALRGLIGTYSSLPVGTLPPIDSVVQSYVRFARDTSLLALQIASPFLALSLLCNFIVGLLGRMTPKLSLYFSALGLIAVVGIALLAVSAQSALNLFGDFYLSWLNSEFDL